MGETFIKLIGDITRIKAIVYLMVVFGLIYLGTNYFLLWPAATLPMLNWEKNVPFLAWTVIFYYLTYFQAGAILLLVNKSDLRKVLMALIGLIVLHGLVFLFFPTVYPRPVFESTHTVWTSLYGVLIYFDHPLNCFPSLHVATSVLVTLIFWRMKKSWGAWSLICTLLVIISTLTLKQHYVVDIVGGLITASGVYYFFKTRSIKIMPVIFLVIFSLLIFTPILVSADSTQAQLEAELKDIERQIAEYTVELGKTQTEKTTLANKIKQLQSQQKSLTLQVKATALKLSDIGSQITEREKSIKSNLTKEQQLNNDIAVVLRQINAVDNNILLALVAADGLSEVFNQVQNYVALTDAIIILQKQNKIIRTNLITEQTILEGQKDEANDLLKIKSIQQQSLNSSISQQNQLLTATKGKESNYQTILSDRKNRAAAIRSRIYELFNTGSQINFGQAVEIAKWAGGITGMRTEFLLAILTQESNLGKNVGTCNRSGDPPEKGWQVIMKPTRDQEPFKKIIEELGLNIDTTPVSCPMKDKNGNQVGWGGAMGPAQFIPSTWMGYKNKVTAITGKSTANPWDIRDAFLAAAIKLKGDGANGTDDGEWKAAMRYFAGSVNLKYRFYGDNVMTLAKQYRTDIADL